MRLNEFTTDYISTDADAAISLEQTEAFWPVSIRDDDVPFPTVSKRRPENERAKLSDER
ncbi:MAG TPA: hypothetical protein VK822_11085 [Acetobacteraceae bacterium]|jgi:hypothetical protein|nr:hypothetical protein [Acetobacteraceae bacterium]